MDFTQKIIDKQHEVQELQQSEAARKTLEKETDDEETQPEMEIPPPEDPDEEWLVLLGDGLQLRGAFIGVKCQKFTLTYFTFHMVLFCHCLCLTSVIRIIINILSISVRPHPNEDIWVLA